MTRATQPCLSWRPWRLGGFILCSLLVSSVAFATGDASSPAIAPPASASVSTLGPADPALAPFSDGLPTDGSSKRPTTAEWRDAPEVRATRAGPRAKGCHLYRLREWVRISCPDLVTASIAVLGGTAKGYAFWIDPAQEGEGGKLPAGGEALFPFQKGDRRDLQFLTFGPGYEGPLTQLPALVLQAHWLDDEDLPVLTLI